MNGELKRSHHKRSHRDCDSESRRKKHRKHRHRESVRGVELIESVKPRKNDSDVIEVHGSSSEEGELSESDISTGEVDKKQTHVPRDVVTRKYDYKYNLEGSSDGIYSKSNHNRKKHRRHDDESRISHRKHKRERRSSSDDSQHSRRKISGDYLVESRVVRIKEEEKKEKRVVTVTEERKKERSAVRIKEEVVEDDQERRREEPRVEVRVKQERDARNGSGRNSREDDRGRSSGGPRDSKSAGPSRGGRRRRDDEEEYDWGADKKVGDVTKVKSEPTDKEKPNFQLSGKLTEERNMVNGVLVKYSEPPESRMPKKRWRLYPFKQNEAMPTLYIHRQSAYLIGRDRKVADLPVDHPSCSKQHAALQYRLVSYERPNGTMGKAIRLYIIDLESANGTFVNSKQIEPKKYVQLLEKDVIKFGFSSREYVLLHEGSKDDSDSDM